MCDKIVTIFNVTNTSLNPESKWNDQEANATNLAEMCVCIADSFLAGQGRVVALYSNVLCYHARCEQEVKKCETERYKFVHIAH